jgi:hypothetical protein
VTDISIIPLKGDFLPSLIFGSYKSPKGSLDVKPNLDFFIMLASFVKFYEATVESTEPLLASPPFFVLSKKDRSSKFLKLYFNRKS